MGIKLLALTGRHPVRQKKGLLGGLGGFAVQDLILTARCAQDAKIAKEDH